MKEQFIELCFKGTQREKKKEANLVKNSRCLEVLVHRGDALRAAAWLDSCYKLSFNGLVEAIQRMVARESEGQGEWAFTRSLTRFVFEKCGIQEEEEEKRILEMFRNLLIYTGNFSLFGEEIELK